MQAGRETLPEFLDVDTILGIKTPLVFQGGPLFKTLGFLVTLVSLGHGRGTLAQPTIFTRIIMITLIRMIVMALLMTTASLY